MGEYVTSVDYIAYFPDVTVAPSDFDYKEAISIDLFKAVLPQPVLLPAVVVSTGTYYKQQFDAAVFEQIKYFDDNPNLFENLSTDTTEFKILGYSEKNDKFDVANQKKRMSPNATLKLDSIALTYAGVNYFG